MSHGRTPRFLPRLGAVFGALALTAGLGLVQSSPAQAEPDIDDVRERVERLWHEAEQASERYNEANEELKDLKAEVGSLESDELRQGAELEVVRERLADSVVRQYEGQGLSAAGEVLLSDDPGAFVSQLSTMSAFDTLQEQIYGDYAAELEALEIREAATKKRTDRVAQLTKQLAAEKEEIDEKSTEAEALLDELEAEQRSMVVSRGSERGAISAAPASGRAQVAVDYAMSKVGGPYVWGGAGPTGFDCSGLTMMAWAQAGVALPHSSAAQFNSGTRISESELAPGDLVFFYSPISHVGMYIGNGMMVHAANPGAGIRVDPLHYIPYVGAVRPG